MNNSGLNQKIYSFLWSAYERYLRTPERSLNKAYDAALKIQKIENEHFNGNKIDSNSTTYSSSIIYYFESDLKKELKIIRMRLTEFRASRYFLSEPNQKALRKRGIEFLELSVILDKLRFIDEVIEKYNSFDQEIIPQDRVAKPIDTPVKSIVVQPRQPDILRKKLDNEPRGKTDTTGVLPRSIFNTINRLQAELDPQAEQNVVQNFRTSQKRTIISIRFILLLIIIPILTHQLSKAFLIGPIIDHVREPKQAVVFLNEEMEEEALLKLQRFEEKIKFENLLANVSPPIENIETQLKEKAEEIAGEFSQESANALKNVFADILSVIAFVFSLLISKREIAVLKTFFDNIVYGLSDSAKAFIIILF